MADCKYKFTDKVNTVELTGFFPEGKEQLLKLSTKQLKGVSPFGVQGGVITEEDLTDELAEWLMARKSAPTEAYPEGEFLYKNAIELKAKSK